MKIILYTPSIHNGGGTERVLVILANYLKSSSYDVCIFAQYIGENYIYDIDKSIEINYIWYDKISRRFNNFLLFKIINKYFGLYILDYGLKKIIKNEPSLIIAFSNSIVLSCYRTSFKSKLIAYEHWPYWIYEANKKLNQKIQKIYPNLKNVVVLTNFEKKIYQQLYCNVSLIENCFSERPIAISNLSTKVVLSIGHFNAQKRRDLLIKSWSMVHASQPDWVLIIVGDGKLLNESKALINDLGLNDSITIIEPTRNISYYYQQSSIFVLSSEFEALPLVLIEAKSYGLPCVSFDIKSGPNEVIRNDIDGFLIEFPNYEQMAQQILFLIQNDELRHKFGEAAYEDAFQRFSSDKFYANWDSLIKAVGVNN